MEKHNVQIDAVRDVGMATHGSNKSVKTGHRCSCGETFETAEELREHAREEHGAIV
jgi:hypothetical protein